MNRKKTTVASFSFEIAKWALVLVLLWPILTFQAQKMPLWRMVFGVLLLVLNVGKIFYDVFLDNFRQKKEQYVLTDLLMLVLGVTTIAVIIGGVIVVIGLYVAQQASSGLAE